MRVRFLEKDERGYFVYEVDYDHAGDPPEPTYPAVSRDGRCVVIRSDHARCYNEEQQNGMCHVHNPNGKYFHQHRDGGPKRIRTVEPIVGDDSYLLLPEQESLF